MSLGAVVDHLIVLINSKDGGIGQHGSDLRAVAPGDRPGRISADGCHAALRSGFSTNVAVSPLGIEGEIRQDTRGLLGASRAGFPFIAPRRTDANGVLLGHRLIDDRRWYVYLLGMVEIMRIREGCRSRLGDRFTLREFHERFMAYGNVPPGLIEPEITASWQ